MRLHLRSSTPAIALAVFISAVISCNSDNTAPTGAFSLTVSPQAATVARGQSVQVEGTINRDNVASSNVSLSVEGLADGITASVSGLSSANGKTRGTITFTVAASVTPGSYTVTIRAASTRSTAATDLTLTVT